MERERERANKGEGDNNSTERRSVVSKGAKGQMGSWRGEKGRRDEGTFGNQSSMRRREEMEWNLGRRHLRGASLKMSLHYTLPHFFSRSDIAC